MSTLFGRLFRRTDTFEGDLATGDWTPIPPSAVARPPDLVGWLSEEGARRPKPPDAAKAEAVPSAAFSPEELAIIEEQRRSQVPVLASQAALSAPTPEPQVAALPPEPEIVDDVAVACPPVESEPRQTWVDVLKAYAEHLNDTELHILRQQFQGS